MGDLKSKKTGGKRDRKGKGKAQQPAAGSFLTGANARPLDAAAPSKNSKNVKEDASKQKHRAAQKPVVDKKKGTSSAASKEEEPVLDEAAVLLREIKSLGGDQEDFELLKDEDSGEEDAIVVEESKDDKKLAKELKSFMASLGDFGTAGKNYAEQTESEEEAEEDESEGDDEEDEDEDDEEKEDPDALLKEEVAEVLANPSSQPAEQSNKEKLKEIKASAVMPESSDSRSGMLVDPNPLWYEIVLPSLPPIDTDAPAPPSTTVAALQARGSQLLTEMSEKFSGSLTSTSRNDTLAMSSTLSASDRAFISQILQSGTSSDKLSALILLSSSSPIHTTPYLTQLLALSKKKSRDEAVRAVRAIVDWLKGGNSSGSGSAAGLPDRKLRWFADQPELKQLVSMKENGGIVKKNGKQPGDQHLVLWAFEDWLKKWYFELLQVMEGLAHDPLPFVRTQMTGHLANLLSSKPEQEQNLLRLLVDKLGDSDRTVSSRTSYHILQLLSSHPMMKNILVKEIASLVLKPAIAPLPVAAGGNKKSKAAIPSGPPSAAAGIRSSDHARYYGIITLNQIMLTRTEQDKLVANRLIEVYFDIFNDLHGTHEDDEDEGEDGTNTLKDRKQRRDEKRNGNLKRKREDDRIKNMPRKERRKLEKSQQALEAESKIMAAVLTGVNRALPYSEIDGNVLHKRVDTLFRIIHTGTFNVGIQSLMLIYQVSSRTQSVSDRFYRVLYDTLIDPRLANSSKQAMYLNLLFKAIKADTSAKRIAAFVKRLTQILSEHQPPFVCGALYLLGELFSLTPSLRSMLTDPEEADDDVETFKDAPESSASEDEAPRDVASAKLPTTRSTRYDGKKRDPQYANASNSCLWEIIPLVQHFHPSVALHASQLLSSIPITTTPDLELHTLSHFLDRFVYRNAKKNTGGGKDSMMKPGAKGQDRSGMVLMRKGAAGVDADRVNVEEFWKKSVDQVPVDQIFFHKFFTKKQEEEEAKAGKVDKAKKRAAAVKGFDDSDDDSDEDEDIDIDGVEGGGDTDLEELPESDMDEDEVWKMMKASMPPAEGDDDLLQDDSDMSDDDDASVAEFAYSDSEDEEVVAAEKGAKAAVGDVDESNSDLGVDEELEENSELGVDDIDEMEGLEDENDDDEEGPQSFFPSDDEDDDALAGFAEEDDDVLGSDAEVDIDIPSATKAADGKKGMSKSQERRDKRRKLKHLPAFASAEAWAHIIDAGDEDEQ